MNLEDVVRVFHLPCPGIIRSKIYADSAVLQCAECSAIVGAVDAPVFASLLELLRQIPDETRPPR